jgi:F-type H+-transporting ATPase subunit a
VSTASAEAAKATTDPDMVEVTMQAVMHHVQDAQEWHLPFLHIPLPGFITLHGTMLVICTGLLLLFFGRLYLKSHTVAPHGLTNLLEVFVLFVRDEISVANLGEKDGRAMAPMFCSMFFFILGLNLMGLIPIFATATGNINVTFALALGTLTLMFYAGISRNGVGGFIKSFVPPGVPAPVLVLLVPLEFMGMFVKAFALMVRLFANMFAGHVVLFSIIGLVVMYGAFASPPAIFMAAAIYCLELFIAFLQAYIFTFLSAIFIGQIMHPEH